MHSVESVCLSLCPFALSCLHRIFVCALLLRGSTCGMQQKAITLMYEVKNDHYSRRARVRFWLWIMKIPDPTKTLHILNGYMRTTSALKICRFLVGPEMHRLSPLIIIMHFFFKIRSLNIRSQLDLSVYL